MTIKIISILLPYKIFANDILNAQLKSFFWVSFDFWSFVENFSDVQRVVDVISCSVALQKLFC